MGLQTLRLRVAAPNPDLEGAFALFRQEHADALLILEEPVVGVHAKRIAELAARESRPGEPIRPFTPVTLGERTATRSSAFCLPVFVFAVPGMHQISNAGFGSINSAKRFRLLQTEASHTDVTTRGLHLAQHLIDRLRNIVHLSWFRTDSAHGAAFGHGLTSHC
jgi:hypothetical protein